jgi:hypothetical protein
MALVWSGPLAAGKKQLVIAGVHIGGLHEFIQ